MYVCHICGKDNTMKDGGWLSKYDVPEAQNGIEGTMGGLTDKGFNYNGAWGGTMQDGGNLMPAMAGANQTVPMAQLGDSVKPITMQLAMGGSLPGAVGFTYARTAGAAPANGPYAKKTKASAQDGKEVEYKELPEITVVGSKDKQTRDFYNNLINKFSEDGNSDNPFVDQEIMGNYLGLMNLGKEYGFPKVNSETQRGIFKNTKGHYNPLTKTIYSSNPNNPNVWVSEMAHHVQMKDNIVGKGLQWLGNDLVQYLKRPALELLNTFKYGTETSPWDYSDEDFDKWVNTNPYEKEGTVENEAHRKIEPMLKEKIKKSRKEYEQSSVAKDRIKRHLYEKKLQNGGEMKFYQEGLDWKPRNISRDGSVIKDDMGQWAHPGEITEISSPYITMEGVPYPVLGISDTGDVQMMYPGEDYEFDGETVTEYPVAKKGISVNNADAQPIKKLDQSLNFTNYNKPTKGGWLDKYK
jgi:hypothetical protein